MKQRGLSDRERAAAYTLTAAKLIQAARQLELQAKLIELKEYLYELRAMLSELCPDYVLETFEEQFSRSKQDRYFLKQMCMRNSPQDSPHSTE